MGKIGQMLSSFSENGVLKKASPVKLEIHANVRRAYPGEAVATDMHELKYLKEDRARVWPRVSLATRIADACSSWSGAARRTVFPRR